MLQEAQPVNRLVCSQILPDSLSSTIDLLQTVCYSRALLFVLLNSLPPGNAKFLKIFAKKVLMRRMQWLNLHTSTHRKQHSEATALASPAAGFNKTENIRLAADDFNRWQL